MAKILDEAKSNIGSPYVFYTVYADEIANSRTVDSVQIDVTVYSHLQYSQSYLGGGYPLTGYLTLNGTEYSIALKGSGDTWSGTTQHRADAQFTVSNLTSSQVKLQNVKFRVSSRSTNDSGYMSNKDCSDIAITMGHLPPNVNTYTLVEQNALLTSAGVSNDTFVDNLSQKQITLTYELHDGATATKYGIYNGITPYLFDTNPFSIDLSTTFLTKSNDKIPIRFAIRDSLNSQGLTSEVLYNNIPYTKISITNSSTVAKRIGQISGQVAISVNGTYYNGIVGNVDQTSYKPTIKYKYWKYGDSEPSTYAHTISSSDISTSDNTFSVSSLHIGSTTETDPNYFDPEYAYRIKVYVEDNFTSMESDELQIQVGEAVWSEYKDRVDFKKLTIGGAEVLESGVDNGIYYEKRSDGVAICYGMVAVSITDSRSAGGLSYYSGSSNVYLPVTYTNTSAMFGFSSVYLANMNRFCQSYVTIEGTDEVQILYTNTTNEARNVNFIVIGKWR